MYKNILFDLDGTLTDPGVGITNSVAYALEKFNISVTDRTQLYPFIGPPLQASFQEYYGFSEADSRLAVEYYRQYFKTKGIYENQVYEGTRELLDLLKANGSRMILATSKPEQFAIEILEHFDLIDYFAFISGATMDGEKVEKADIIRYALKKTKNKNLQETVMVGDRKYDIIGAAQNGIDAVGVLFGYGTREELENAGAKYFAETPFDIFRKLFP